LKVVVGITFDLFEQIWSQEREREIEKLLAQIIEQKNPL
jgi:hypothetical protein